MKQIKTELPIIISTGYTHERGDVLESVRQQVEVLAFHLQSVFNFIRRSAIHEESDDPTARSFCNDLMNFSDIGEGLALSIWRAISELTELQTKDEPNEIEAVKPAQTVAEQLSALLNNSDLPAPLYNVVKDALNDFYTEVDQTGFRDEQQSPAYIRRMLENSNYFKIGGEVADDE